jgi:helicase-like protein
LLENLNGLDQLKELFWNELNYERINEPISRRGWNETAAKCLADDPLVFAGGGENNDFKIVLARLDSDHVRLGLQRPVINRLLRDFPYALFLFSNRDRNAWHFVNVKYDHDPKRRQLFRRISVAPGDRLRTASERMATLDLETIGAQASPLTIQDRHDEAFDVEKVTKKFFDDFVEVFAAVAKDIGKHNNWEQNIVEKETQTLLNRLLFLYFIQRKGWLNRERDYLYKRFNEQFRKDRDAFNYYSNFLHPLFIRLSTEMKEAGGTLGDLPFLNGGLFDDEYGGQQRQDKFLRRTRMKVSNRTFAHVFDDVLEKYNFTVRQYADTARYLFDNLNPNGNRDDIDVIFSGDKSVESVVGRFAPNANPEYKFASGESELSTVVATDVLSEGLNLQDCDKMINYDLHWNPVRLIQRFGRIDRIGSDHEKVHGFNFLPETGLDKNLGLREKLHNRIQEIHETIGEDAKILDQTEELNEEAMYAIYDSKSAQLSLFEDEKEELLDLNEAEEILRQLRSDNPAEYERITQLRDGIRSAKISTQKGMFVFW